MELIIKYIKDIPQLNDFKSLVENVIADFGLEGDAKVEMQQIDREEALAYEEGQGFPTLFVDGRMIEDGLYSIETYGLSVYGSSVVPDRWMVESAILRALRPKHILFLCRHNSARSIMAQVIASKLAWTGTKVSSAGVEMGFLNPFTITCLKEAGYPVWDVYSKTVDEIDVTDVDAVVTLCDAGACPNLAGKRYRLHWEMRDPANAEGDDGAKLRAFRNVREELALRLKHLFAV